MRKLRFRRGALASNPIEMLEDRRFLSVSTVVIGTGGSSGVTFSASNGRYEGISTKAATATLVFSGPVSPVTIHGHVYFPRGFVESIDSIVMTDAVPHRASLKEIATPGTGVFDVGSISGGNLSTIIMPDVNLVGSLDLSSITSMTFGQVSGAAINLGTGAGTIKIDSTMSGSLTAATLGSLTTTELIQESITTTGPFAKSKLQIGSINSGTGIEQSEIVSTGNIGNVRTKFIDDSVITAGTDGAASTTLYPTVSVPEYASAFVDQGSIRNLQIIHASNSGYFNNSVVAAYTIGSLQLGQMGNTGGGVAAHTIGVIGFMAPPGSQNLYNIGLGYSQMRTTARLAATLTARDIPFQEGLLGPENILVVSLNLNVLG